MGDSMIVCLCTM